MDRICPFLALEADLRSAMDGYDPEHRCRAVEVPLVLDRVTQLQLCLGEGHTECERFKERTAELARRRRIPLPAADARFVSTRLTLEPDPGWRPMGLGARPMHRGRTAITGAALLLIGAAGAAASTKGFGLMTAATVPTAEPTPTATENGVLSATPTPSPVPTATQRATASASPTARPVTPSPVATPRVYVVQKGDSLSAIAQRFGVTINALMSANGLTNPDLVNVGQVLVIPR